MTWVDILSMYGLCALVCAVVAGAMCMLSQRFSDKSSLGITILAAVFCPVTVLVVAAWLGWQARLLPGVLMAGIKALRSLRPPAAEKIAVPKATARPPEVQAIIEKRSGR